MATSSALTLGDLGLVWSNVAVSADLVKIDDDLASDVGLVTAILLSLYLDRRAGDDDVPPSGDVTDRRGWWADEFAAVEGDLIGSRLWLLDRSKRTAENQGLAVEYSRESLQWAIVDRAVERLDIEAELTVGVQLIQVTAYRPGRDPIALRFSHAWDATIAEDLR
jgi:phage gp46-like protein